jgi:hypothetical protein
MDATDRRAARCRAILRSAAMRTFVKARIDRELPAIFSNPGELAKYLPVLTPSQVQALLETITGVGALRLPDNGSCDRIVLWNNQRDPGFSFQESVSYETWGRTDECKGGTVPSFRVVLPEEDFGGAHTHWQIRVDYFGLSRAVFSNGEEKKD